MSELPRQHSGGHSGEHPGTHPHTSPALLAMGEQDAPAFELKFLLDDQHAGRVEDWARTHLALDPHGDASLGGAYHTTTLYFDTPELDVFHRTPSYGRRKFRARRYGMTSSVYLERKTKTGDRVSKRRVQLPCDDVALLANPMALETWPGQWFHQRLRLKNLQPAARIAYRRSAYVGACAEGPLRMTFDRELHGALTNDWRLLPGSDGLPLLARHVIVELKFLRALPQPFKDVVRDFRLNPTTVSKYRLCRDAWGAVSGTGGVNREAARA